MQSRVIFRAEIFKALKEGEIYILIFLLSLSLQGTSKRMQPLSLEFCYAK